MRNGIRWCAFSGSGIEFAARTKSLKIELFADSTVTDPGNMARVAVFVNGERTIDRMMDEERVILDVYEGEEKALCVRVIKLSESAMSTFGIGTIDAGDGSICPTADKGFLIEFIGDSITCGYGVDDENELHNFKTSTEDCTRAFAYKTAEKLGVDYSLVSFSGYGVYSGYTGDGVQNTSELLPQHYRKLGFSYATSGAGEDKFRVADVVWDFKRQPDMVFINLGTNDASFCGEDKEKQAGYVERYIDFLRNVRACNPNARIVCGLGMMGDVLYPALCTAANTYSAVSGDLRVSTIHFDPIKAETEGYVADYHPTERTHERCAKQLATELSRILKAELAKVGGQKLLALTFDDGPAPNTTRQILDILKKNDIKATFFAVGEEAQKYPDVVKECCEAGHEIENHSFSHPALPELTDEEAGAQIEETSQIIAGITGRRPEFFRPPYIAVDDRMRENIALTMIAGFGAQDWDESVSAPERAQMIISAMRPGAIILLHDKEGNDKTVEALPSIIAAAKGLGYEFVKIRELFERMEVAPRRGLVYNGSSMYF